MVKKNHFERFAKHYDFLTKILMLGTYWSVRKRIVFGPRAKTALDLCCGTGYVTGHIEADTVIALDMSPGMLKFNKEKNVEKKNIHLVSGDAFSLPFPDSSFEVVYWTLASHEFKDVSAILRDVFRVLKKGGRLVLYDFSKPENIFLRYTYLPFLKNIVELGTFFVYNGEEWKDILSNIGFHNIETEPLYKASFLIHTRK